MRSNDRSFERAMALAALSGLKIALGPAMLANARGWPGRENWLMVAMGEMFLDKLGVFPPRYRPSLLIPHSLMGGYGGMGGYGYGGYGYSGYGSPLGGYGYGYPYGYGYGVTNGTYFSFPNLFP